MKILILGDLHIKKKNCSLWNDIQEEIYKIIEEKKIDLFVSLGDTLDTHERIDMRCLHTAVNFYTNISKKCLTYVLIGNHDRENNRDYCTTLHPFFGLSTERLKFVDTPCEYQKLLFIPYVPKGKFNDALLLAGYNVTEPDVNRPNFIFAHQEFYGCKMNNTISDKGDKWSPNLPNIISGHIHDYQQLGNILYVGTPFQHDYNESHDKALLYLDLKGGVERIPLKCITKKYTYSINPQDIPAFINMLPKENAVSGRDVDLKNKILIKVVVNVEATDVKVLKNNEFYKTLSSSVDKVDLNILNEKTNHAVQFIEKVRSSGKNVSLVELVKNMLEKDEYTLKLYTDLL